MRQKGFVLLLIPVVIILVFSGIGWLLLKNNQITIFPIPTPTSSPTGDTTANWKTYTNKTLGYSLSYPKDYAMTGEDQAGNTTFVSPTKGNDALVISISDSGEFNGNPDDYFKDLEEYFKSAGISSTVDSIKKIKVNGMDAVYSKYSHEGGGEIYFLLHNHKRIMIDKTPIITSKQHEFDQILSTFKFIVESDNKPIVLPVPNTIVVSPLYVKGKVPSGWMFEGQFPIKLLDSKRKVIATASAHETKPGSWTSGNPVDFEATLQFSTSDKNGYLILEYDNPSGKPANSKTYEIPVKFSDNKETKYTCPEGGWVNCMPILTEEAKKACSSQALEWYKKNCPDFKGLAE